MFHIQCFVDDKNLGEVFKRLVGIARDLKHVYVPNVEGDIKPNGKATVQGNNDMFAKEIRKRKLSQLTGPEFKSIVEGLKLPTSSYSYHLQQMVKHGFLKKGKMVGNALMYHVVDK